MNPITAEAPFCDECFSITCTCPVPLRDVSNPSNPSTLDGSDGSDGSLTRDPDGLDGSGGSLTPGDDLASILDDLVAFAADYIAWPIPEMGVAWSLWVAHTYLLDHFDSTPRLAVIAPEKQSGKTRVLEVTESVALLPERASDVSTAALFRLVGSDSRPTILLDEVDAIWHGKGQNEELRSLVNGGHRRGNTVLRMTGEGASMKSTRFATFAAVALAGIGDLPETVMDRAVVLRMKRRRPTDRINRWRFRTSGSEGEAIADRLTRYAEHVAALPEVADDPTIQDRAFDVWEPLFSIAAAAGGEWPQVARAACHAITVDTALEDYSLALRCVMELRTVWPDGERWVSTVELLSRLYTLDDSLWSAEGDGPFEHGLSARKLALFLKRYDVHPSHNHDRSARGYARSALEDAWSRYGRPQEPPNPSNPSGTRPMDPSEPSNPSEELNLGRFGRFGTVPEEGTDLTDLEPTEGDNE